MWASKEATMARLSSDLEIEGELEDEFEGELEDEIEGELEDEWEGEDEDEAFLGALGGIARGLGGLLGEGEEEDEWEGEEEDEAFLGALGGIARGLGGLLGEGEEEDEWEGEDEDEAEEFFKGLGRAFRVASPFLRVLAKTAGPLIATAVGGPAAGMIARKLTAQLEGEGEDEVEAEFEDMATAPVPASQALGEYFAAQAASAESESEAEAFAGVASYMALSSRDRRDLERMLPALLRGSAVITRLLHGNRRTRQAVRLVPGIVDAAGRTLSRRIAAGEPVGSADVGQVLGASARRVFSGGTARQAVMRRHARGLAHARRHRGHHGRYGYQHGQRRGYRTSYGTGRRPHHAGTVRRQPARSAVVAHGGVVPRPRPGTVRVVTPVRVPSRGGRPAHTVRVVSDVRVPRGAVAAGRPAAVSAPRRRGR
jgi:hypothetical protein